MSYKHYSKEAVEQIMQKVVETQKIPNIPKNEFEELTADELIKVGESAGYNADKIREAVYEYDHPSKDKNQNIENTHILLKREFKTTRPEDEIWDKILHELRHHFVDEASGKVKELTQKKIWTHINHANHETVVSLTKNGTIAELKLSQRLGFWSTMMEGVLHGAYLSLIIFGFIYAIIRSPLLINIGIIASLWILSALIIKRVSEISREKKIGNLNAFVDKIISDLSEN